MNIKNKDPETENPRKVLPLTPLMNPRRRTGRDSESDEVSLVYNELSEEEEEEKLRGKYRKGGD